MKDMYPNTKHITSCDLSPLIFHNQTHLHNHIYKEQSKDSFYSELVLQSIITIACTLLGMAGGWDALSDRPR